MLICNSGGWTEDWSIGNRGTVVRYNVSINDGIRDFITGKIDTFFSPVIHVTGPVKETLIEKNLFFMLKKPSPITDKTLISLTDWRGYADSTFFVNNYIYAEEPFRIAEKGWSTANFFAGNRYEGMLLSPEEGFAKEEGLFEQRRWLDGEDENWNRLIGFVKDKRVMIGDTEYKVTDIMALPDEVALRETE